MSDPLTPPYGRPETLYREGAIVSFVGPDAAPPVWSIEDAESAASRSPCQKRKVGIDIYRCVRALPGGRELVVDTMASGYNGPPWTYEGDDPLDEGDCDGSEACRRDCARRCVHAEPRAIDAVIDSLRDHGNMLRMVHVKLDDAGKLMACDGPSCVECSKLILDCGIGGIWLYELPTVAEANAAGVTHMDDPRHVALARWRYYPALEFHEATLDRLRIYQIRKGVPT